jgi:hypothetical protein
VLGSLRLTKTDRLLPASHRSAFLLFVGHLLSPIGATQTSRDVRYQSILEVKADMPLNSAEFTFDPNPTWSGWFIRGCTWRACLVRSSFGFLERVLYRLERREFVVVEFSVHFLHFAEVDVLDNVAGLRVN